MRKKTIVKLNVSGVVHHHCRLDRRQHILWHHRQKIMWPQSHHRYQVRLINNKRQPIHRLIQRLPFNYANKMSSHQRKQMFRSRPFHRLPKQLHSICMALILAVFKVQWPHFPDYKTYRYSIHFYNFIRCIFKISHNSSFIERFRNQYLILFLRIDRCKYLDWRNRFHYH